MFAAVNMSLGGIRAWDPSTGATLWSLPRLNVPATLLQGSQLFVYATGTGESLFAGPPTGSVAQYLPAALDPATGTVLWSAATSVSNGANPQGLMAQRDGILCVSLTRTTGQGTPGGPVTTTSFTGIDSATGSLAWRTAGVSSAAGVVDTAAGFVGVAASGALFSVSISAGVSQWTTAAGVSVAATLPAVAPDGATLYVVAPAGGIVPVLAATGALSAAIGGAGFSSAPAVSSSALYAASTASGALHAFGLPGGAALWATQVACQSAGSAPAPMPRAARVRWVVIHTMRASR
jgi:hypothetical protein